MQTEVKKKCLEVIGLVLSSLLELLNIMFTRSRGLVKWVAFVVRKTTSWVVTLQGTSSVSLLKLFSIFELS